MKQALVDRGEETVEDQVMHIRVVGVCGLFLAVGLAAQKPSEDLAELQEKAMKAAVLGVAPSVVQIETTGGADIVTSGTGQRATQLRKGVGPTTGLVVGEDGRLHHHQRLQLRQQAYRDIRLGFRPQGTVSGKGRCV
jgi:hypothetical protein